ncbi:MAG: DNA polymerase III subunit delta [Nitrospira sp.]|nr:DNA polymerase III subunit delta [Nitrospira sp.]
MSYQVLLQEIEKGLPSPLYLLYASDSFLLREAVGLVKSLVPEGERDFNLHIFDLLSPDEPFSIQQIIDTANMFPFFGERRFSILSGDLKKLSEKDLKLLDSYISNPAPHSVFVMLHEGELKKEMRERFRASKVVFLDIKESEIPSWIKHKAHLKGLEITDDVADYLLGLIGPSLGLLSAEIDKVSLLGKKQVSIEDISEIIAGGRFYSPFELVDALRQKDAERVFRIYKELKGTTEDYSLIGVLNWLYGRSLTFKPGQKREEHLSRVFEILNKADIDIKSSGIDYPVEYLLVRLLRL